MSERDILPGGQTSEEPAEDLQVDPPGDAAESKPEDEGRAGKFTSRFGISREMTDEEVQDLLTRSWWGSLATVEAEGPYSVPVIYGC